MPPPVTCANACASVAQPADVVEVQARRGEQVGAVVVLDLEDAAHEREAVRVDAGGRQADDDVAALDARAVDQAVALDDPDARAREVELLVAVDAGQLRRLAADERAARGAADVRHPLDELRDLLELDPVRGDVVEQEERVRAGRDHVVDAVRGEVGAARAQPAALSCENELRPDAVGRRCEQPLAVERMKPGEGAEALCPGRLDRRTQPVDDRAGRCERDAGRLVRLPLHLS